MGRPWLLWPAHRTCAVTAPGVSLINTIATIYANRIAKIKNSLINKLLRAQETMWKHYYKYYLNIKFKEGDAVILKHINIRSKKGRKKLSYKKLEPYIINHKFGPIAYKLNLPQDLKINIIFHINDLEKWTPLVEG